MIEQLRRVLEKRLQIHEQEEELEKSVEWHSIMNIVHGIQWQQITTTICMDAKRLNVDLLSYYIIIYL